MARRNAPCDMDCLNCTRPASRCNGGRTTMKLRQYHRMTDGKKGEDMPGLAFGKGGKKTWR